jgi:lipopolysaccharide/colanic/teichoic acid biosynthesis glycosyltransferase/GT2 family glycosyltransferase
MSQSSYNSDSIPTATVERKRRPAGGPPAGRLDDPRRAAEWGMGPDERPQEAFEPSGAGDAPRRDALYRRALAAADALSAATALVVGLLVVGDGTLTAGTVAAPAVAVVMSKVMGLYDRDQLLLRKTTLDEAPALFQVATAYSLLVWAAGDTVGAAVQPFTGAGKADILVLWAVLFTMMLLTRVLARRLARRRAEPERCLVLGDEEAAQRVLRSFEVTPLINATVVGHVPLHDLPRGGDGSGEAVELTELRRRLEEHDVERVVVATGGEAPERVLHAVRLVKGVGVKVSVLPDLFQIVGSSARVDEVDGLLLLGLSRQGLTRSSRSMKRSVDIAGAGAALVLLAPFFAITGLPLLLVRRRTKGTAEGSARQTATMLRRLTFEGAPQLMAVIRGEKSLVGPLPRAGRSSNGRHAVQATNGNGSSPHGVNANGRIGPDIGQNGHGSNGHRPAGADVETNPRGDRPLLPGLTGLWRTRRAQGAAPEDIEQLDYLYGANWSLWLDAQILLRTMPALLAPRRAARLPGAPGAATQESARADVLRVPSRRRLRTPKRAATPPRTTSLTAIVPATNDPDGMDRCVAAIHAAAEPPEEIILVEDPAEGGAGGARNAGARAASSDVLVFIDADVTVHPDAFQRIRSAFDRDPELTGVFGSYDDEPSATDVVSGFRNLLHHHVHQSAVGVVTTFWAGLGALRRDAFMAAEGFDASHPIEDIELGMRLCASGARIRLDPELRGKHLKAWTIREMLLTDFIIRGAPWIELMLHHKASSRSLNLAWRHRLSAGACVLGVQAIARRRPRVAAGAAVGFVALNRSFYALLLRRGGPVQAGAGVGLHALHHLASVAAVPAGVVLHLARKTAPASPALLPEHLNTDVG